jgi:hypothetical protein
MTCHFFIIFISMVIGQVWIILIQPEYILDWMGKYIDMAIRFPRLHKLLTCSVCMAGQTSLWLYLIVSVDKYSFTTHFCIVAITIWATAITNRLFNHE